MRALGPGSVSSFLKVILDVVYAGLWVLLGLVALGTIIALLFSFDPGLTGTNWSVSDPWVGGVPHFCGA